jgi:heme/copper-type cytochrome/quinol oxidase subunit 2
LNRGCRAYTFRRDFHIDIRPITTAAFNGSVGMTVRSALFWVAAACCVLAELAILRSLLFGRARAAEQSGTGQFAAATRARRPAEIAWALLPAVGLLFVLYLTWRVVDVPSSPAADVSRSGVSFGG